MNRDLISWLLAGALAASLSWNLRLLRHPAGEPPPASASCAAGSCGAFDCAALGLDAEQSAALERACQSYCGESERLDQRAAALQRELFLSLSASNVDQPAARRLAGEVADLRRRSLDACLDGVFAVREVLTLEQLSALLAACRAGGGMTECPPLPAGQK